MFVDTRLSHPAWKERMVNRRLIKQLFELSNGKSAADVIHYQMILRDTLLTILLIFKIPEI